MVINSCIIMPLVTNKKAKHELKMLLLLSLDLFRENVHFCM